MLATALDVCDTSSSAPVPAASKETRSQAVLRETVRQKRSKNASKSDMLLYLWLVPRSWLSGQTLRAAAGSAPKRQLAHESSRAAVVVTKGSHELDILSGGCYKKMRKRLSNQRAFLA